MKLTITEIGDDPKRLLAVLEMRRAFLPTVYQEADFSTNEKRRDKEGRGFLIYQSGAPIGSFRLVPLGKHLTLAERADDLDGMVSLSGTYEVQRFIILPKFRGLHRTMNVYRQTAIYLRDRTPVRSIVAVCSQRISGLLKRTGMNVIAEHIVLDGKASHYSLLSASIVEINDKLNLDHGETIQ